MVVAFVLALGGCAQAPAEGDGPATFTLRVGMTATNGVVQGNLGWADEQGTLSRALRPVGVEKIEFSFFQAGTEVQAALLSGAIDVAVSGDMPALTTRANGGKTRLLGFSTINANTALIGRKDGPTTIDGLVGKVVTAPHGTIRYRVLYGMLQKAGLADDVEIANVPTPEAIAGLRSGKVDALTIGGTTAALLEKQGFVVIDDTSRHPDLASTEPNTVLQTFLDEHPGFAEAWGRGIVETNTHIRENPEKYWTYSADKDDVAVELARAAEPVEHFNLEPLPKEGVDQLKSTYEFLREQNLLKEPFDIDGWLVR